METRVVDVAISPRYSMRLRGEGTKSFSSGKNPLTYLCQHSVKNLYEKRIGLMYLYSENIWMRAHW